MHAVSDILSYNNIISVPCNVTIFNYIYIYIYIDY